MAGPTVLRLGTRGALGGLHSPLEELLGQLRFRAGGWKVLRTSHAATAMGASTQLLDVPSLPTEAQPSLRKGDAESTLSETVTTCKSCVGWPHALSRGLLRNANAVAARP
jgi:hypothetical protein